MKISILFLILYISNLGYAQLSSFDFNGYVKYLFSSAEYPVIDERFNDHLIHSRLNTRWYPSSSLTAALELRTRIFVGESVQKITGYSDLIKSQQGLVDLDLVLWDRASSLGYSEIDRLWIDWVVDDWQITLGRQRIAWGTSWAWNPIDLFNPKEVLDFDYEELPGVDALRIQYYTGPVTKFELAVSPESKIENSIAAALLTLNHWGYDFNILAAFKNKTLIFGTGWVGDILDAGFRGEVLFTQDSRDKSEEFLSHPLQTESLRSKRTRVSVVLSGDYTFPNSFYIHTEFLFNSNGTIKNSALYQLEAMELDMLTPARWSIFQEVAYQLTPLLRSSIFCIINPDDRSYIIVPSMSYSLITNFDLYLTGFFGGGNSLSEFGNSATSLFARLKYSF